MSRIFKPGDLVYWTNPKSNKRHKGQIDSCLDANWYFVYYDNISLNEDYGASPRLIKENELTLIAIIEGFEV